MLAAATALGVCGGLIATFLGYFGGWHWTLDLFSHFRVHYLVVFAIGLAATLALRQRRVAVLALLGLAINGVEVGPAWWPPPEPIAAEAAHPRLRLVTINLLSSNREEAAVLAYLRTVDPDLVAIEEVNARWASALGRLADRLPYRVVAPREDNFGVALLSRYPIATHEVKRYRAFPLPWIAAEIETPLGRLAVSVVHPVPPVSAGSAAARDAAIGEIAGFAGTSTLPKIFLGDFNATPWSLPLRRLSGALHLAGSGIAATWPAKLGPLGIPIDHILVDRAFRIVRREVGPPVGSDHRPVLVEITGR